MSDYVKVVVLLFPSATLVCEGNRLSSYSGRVTHKHILLCLSPNYDPLRAKHSTIKHYRIGLLQEPNTAQKRVQTIYGLNS